MCPTYRHQEKSELELKMKPSTRELQSELRKLVLEEDEFTCQRCGKTDMKLFCHHIKAVVSNPIESADINNCIGLCESCHKNVHSQPGCRFFELRCKA